MEPLYLDHFTLRVPSGELGRLHDFYARVLTLAEGPRPDFSFPGHWFYIGERPVIHLAGNAPPDEQAPPAGLPTGRFNHVSLRWRGLAATRAHLSACAVPWTEATVPGAPLHQLFLHDPTGLMIELTFDAAELAQAGAPGR